MPNGWGSIKGAAANLGVAHSTLHRWLGDYPELRHALRPGQGKCLAFPPKARRIAKRIWDRRMAKLGEGRLLTLRRAAGELGVSHSTMRMWCDTEPEVMRVVDRESPVRVLIPRKSLGVLHRIQQRKRKERTELRARRRERAVRKRLTPAERKRRLLDLEGSPKALVSGREAARLAGVDSGLVYQWLKSEPELRAAVKRTDGRYYFSAKAVRILEEAHERRRKVAAGRTPKLQAAKQLAIGQMTMRRWLRNLGLDREKGLTGKDMERLWRMREERAEMLARPAPKRS